jgi:ABC-2 type transport system ATP-binding protein
MSKGMCQKVAVAQALLPGSGLLVLDEAWTGLDTEARTALDEAVAERVADGGSVVFVDHDPRRLDHLEADRWRIERGQAVRVSDDRPRTSPATVSQIVVIEVTVCPREVLDGFGGVISVRWDGDRAFVRVAEASDSVLRRLLDLGDDVHIRNVRPEAANGGRQ